MSIWDLTIEFNYACWPGPHYPGSGPKWVWFISKCGSASESMFMEYLLDILRSSRDYCFVANPQNWLNESIKS